LRALKEARLRRHQVTSPVNSCPAFVDRRYNSTPPSATAMPRPARRPNFVAPRVTSPTYASQYLNPPAPDPPSHINVEDEYSTSTYSASTKSSTRFGGNNFEICLELD
jgi:hypothetical protein